MILSLSKFIVFRITLICTAREGARKLPAFAETVFSPETILK